MKIQISELERHAKVLFERIERLQDKLPDFVDACLEYVTAWGRRKRWDFLMQNLRHLVLKLHQVSETMHTKLAELAASLSEDELSGGTACIISPHKRFSQEQTLLDLTTLRSQNTADYCEVTDLLGYLIELTEHGDGAAQEKNILQEDVPEDLLDVLPPRVADARAMMQQLQTDMRNDAEATGDNMRRSAARLLALTAATAAAPSADATTELHADTAQAVAGFMDSCGQRGDGPAADTAPRLIAIADFQPPPTHQTQMLRLRVGDEIAILGQDGRGWWFGRDKGGKEGWFPPSYVQQTSAHFSSGIKT